MRSAVHVLKILAFVLVFALISAAPSLAAGSEVAAAVFTWKNMSLMGPGDESGHYVSVTRVSEVLQHSVEYHEGSVVQKIILYKTEDEARFRLLGLLRDAAEGWNSHYEADIVDGSSWRVVIHYADGTAREFGGYGKEPPRANEIESQVLKLAEYEIRPKLF